MYTPPAAAPSGGGGAPAGLTPYPSLHFTDPMRGAGEFTAPRMLAVTSTNTANGVMYLAPFRALKTETVGQLGPLVRTAQSGANAPTLQRCGLYSVDDVDGHLTLIAATANDPTIGAGTGFRMRAVTAPVQKTAGHLYAFALLTVGATTPPSVQQWFLNAGLTSEATQAGALPRLVMAQITAQADLPAGLTDAQVTPGVLTAPLFPMGKVSP